MTNKKKLKLMPKCIINVDRLVHETPVTLQLNFHRLNV